MSPSNKKQYLSKEGMKELEEKLRFLTEEKRTEISKRLEESIALGDLSENAEYHEAKDAQLMNEQKIAEVENLLSNSEILSQKKGGCDKVSLGCKVELKKEGEKKIFCYTIVSSQESDPVANKISNESPIGRSVLNKAKGEKVNVSTPSGKIEYTVLKISY